MKNEGVSMFKFILDKLGIKTFRYASCPHATIDPFTKRQELVHNGGFPKFELLYCSQNTVKWIKIQ